MLSERNSIKLRITKNQWPLPDIPHELTLDMQATILVHLGRERGIVNGKMNRGYCWSPVHIVISDYSIRVRVIKNLVFFLLAFLGSGMAWIEILLNFLFSEECGVANGYCAARREPWERGWSCGQGNSFMPTKQHTLVFLFTILLESIQFRYFCIAVYTSISQCLLLQYYHFIRMSCLH